MVYIHTCMQNTQTHKFKKKKRLPHIPVLDWTIGTNLNTDEEVKPDVCVCMCYQTYLFSLCICWEGLDTINHIWCPDLTLVASKSLIHMIKGNRRVLEKWEQ